MTMTPTATNDITAQIAVAYRELVMRERANAHLGGIPRRQNESAISGLYDTLNHLHIARIEAEEAEVA
jgi:hypothetical protein